MKNFNLKGMVDIVAESVKKVDKVKLLGTVGLVLGAAASWMSNEADKQTLDKNIEEKAEKAVQKLLKKNEGAQ